MTLYNKNLNYIGWETLFQTFNIMYYLIFIYAAIFSACYGIWISIAWSSLLWVLTSQHFSLLKNRLHLDFQNKQTSPLSNLCRHSDHATHFWVSISYLTARKYFSNKWTVNFNAKISENDATYKRNRKESESNTILF